MTPEQAEQIKTDAKLQIEMIEEQVMFPEIYEMTTIEVNEMKRRKTFLKHLLTAPCHEFGPGTKTFVYGK